MKGALAIDCWPVWPQHSSVSFILKNHCVCVGVFGGLLLDIHVHVHVHIGGCLALFYCPFEASVYGIEVLNHKHLVCVRQVMQIFC